ncbi:MAG: hypothetical protein EPN30_10560 [Actinomycetota bacterium]|nr:MAG: hypothetical protein EPN30_10560 [Actinomycetota bacterium]
METIVNTVIKQILSLFTNGFLSGIEGSELWLFSRLDQLVLGGSQAPVSSAWFYQFFQKMELLALALVLPLLLIGVLGSMISGAGGHLLRLVGIYLPVSLVGSGLFLFAFRTLATCVDAMCTWLAGSAHVSLESLVPVSSWVSVRGDAANPIPFLLIALAGILSLVGSFSLYFELLVRDGVMMILAAFIPFAVLFVLLRASRAVLFRYVEVTVGVLFSKLVVVVLLCLGGDLVTHSTSLGDFSQFMAGASMIILASFSPFLLFGLIPFAHLDHQSQISQVGRRSVAGISRKGALMVGGPATSSVPEIPLASATAIPSYLKQSR